MNYDTSSHEIMTAHSASGTIRNSVTKSTMRTLTDSPGYSLSDHVPVADRSIDPEKLIIAAMPALNEERYIARTIVGAKKFVTMVLVVDDGSTDDTAEIAMALGAVVVRHDSNRGYGGALKTIFETARNLHAYELVILDSDGQHDPKYIPDLLKPLGAGFDIVIGSRFISGEKTGVPPYRVVGMKVLDIATNFAGEINISDSQSGFRAYGRKAIENITFMGNGMSAGSEILLQMKDNNLQFTEVPIKVRYDLEDKSSQNPFSHGISVLNSIIGILGYKRPLLSLGIPVIIMMLIGILSGSWANSMYYQMQMLPLGPTFLSGITMMAGLLLTATALILNLSGRRQRMKG
jgi:glycosyltransferase involved in cell wall biosynthesis